MDRDGAFEVKPVEVGVVTMEFLCGPVRTIAIGLSKTNVALRGVPDASRVHAQRRPVGCGVDGEDAGVRSLGLRVVDAETLEGVFHLGVSKERQVIADLFERVEIGAIRFSDVVEY